MSNDLPHNRWEPLSREEVTQLFADAPFVWGLAGGHAVEQFVGTSIREHSDTDILVFRDERLRVQHWLSEWRLFAADPPGTLRPWLDGECLPYGIHDIWGHRRHVQAWQLQVMLAEVDADHWFMRGNPRVRGRRNDLIVRYHGVPCIRIEVQLLYKARSNRAKDTADFQACLPYLSADANEWLKRQLPQILPTEHPWLEYL